jgi:hypothetical protein
VNRLVAAFTPWLCAAIPAFAQNTETLPLVGFCSTGTVAPDA